MEWFRLYSDVRSDNKLKTLTDSEFRVWVNLLCVASEQPDSDRGTIPADDLFVLAAEVAGTDETLLGETLAKLIRLRIVSMDDGIIHFLKWDKRQFASDNSTIRVQKHRAKKVQQASTVAFAPRNTHETFPKQDVTPSDTDTDTETDTENKQQTHPTSADAAEVYSPDFEQFWTLYPRKLEKRAAYKAWRARIKAGVPPASLIAAAEHYAAHCAASGKPPEYVKHAKTFLGPSGSYEDWVEGAPEAVQERASPGRATSVADQNAALLAAEWAAMQAEGDYR